MFLLDTEIYMDNTLTESAKDIFIQLTSHINFDKLTEATETRDTEVLEFLSKTKQQLRDMETTRSNDIAKNNKMCGILLACVAVFAILGMCTTSVILMALAMWTFIIGMLAILIMSIGNKSNDYYATAVKRIIRSLESASFDAKDETTKRMILKMKHKAEDFQDQLELAVRNEQSNSQSMNTAIWLSILR